jgi:hypothetical protein
MWRRANSRRAPLVMLFTAAVWAVIQERVRSGRAEYARAYAAGQVGAGKRRESKSNKSNKNVAPHRPMKVFRGARPPNSRLRHELGAISKQLQIPVTTIRESVQNGA